MTAPPLSLERPFLDGCLAVRVSADAVTFPFVDFAQAIASEYGGAIVARLGAPGTDEVYWDIRVADQTLTLHSQHYLGVFLCATDRASEDLLRTLLPFAESYLRDRAPRSSRQ